MKTVSGLSQLPLDVPGSVVTLGVFDGVHRGHQTVIGRAVERGHRAGLPTVAVTFSGHPDSTLHGQVTPMLTSIPYRLILLERQGVDCCVVLEFTQELSRMSAGEFVERVLVEGLKANAVVVGFDSRFGRNREGDVTFLTTQGNARGFAVESVGPVESAGQRISSTAIRQRVAAGDFEGTRAMLGRPYSVMGTVIGGSHRGGGLGFPTANLDLAGIVLPPEGVYVANALLEGREYQSLVSVGDRPTFGDEPGNVVVEAFLLDFRGTLYGRDVELQFLRRLREQVRYESVEALKAQMNADLAYARRFFAGDVEG